MGMLQMHPKQHLFEAIVFHEAVGCGDLAPRCLGRSRMIPLFRTMKPRSTQRGAARSNHAPPPLAVEDRGAFAHKRERLIHEEIAPMLAAHHANRVARLRLSESPAEGSASHPARPSILRGEAWQ
jgi:hypothetical protein